MKINGVELEVGERIVGAFCPVCDQLTARREKRPNECAHCGEEIPPPKDRGVYQITSVGAGERPPLTREGPK